jgi:hypothetical protein
MKRPEYGRRAKVVDREVGSPYWYQLRLLRNEFD